MNTDKKFYIDDIETGEMVEVSEETYNIIQSSRRQLSRIPGKGRIQMMSTAGETMGENYIRQLWMGQQPGHPVPETFIQVWPAPEPWDLELMRLRNRIHRKIDFWLKKESGFFNAQFPLTPDEAFGRP
jgi:hypothetical protein